MRAKRLFGEPGNACHESFGSAKVLPFPLKVLSEYETSQRYNVSDSVCGTHNIVIFCLSCRAVKAVNTQTSPPCTSTPSTTMGTRIADNLDWKELSEEQLEAAKSLGYTQEVWDGNGTIPLENKGWQELSADEQAAAKTLGYDQQSWNHGSGNVDDLDWDELNDEQLKAAKKLGYTKVRNTLLDISRHP